MPTPIVREGGLLLNLNAHIQKNLVQRTAEAAGEVVYRYFENAESLPFIGPVVDKYGEKRDDLVKLGWDRANRNTNTNSIWHYQQELAKAIPLVYCLQELLKYAGIEDTSFITLMNDEENTIARFHRDRLKGGRGLLLLSGLKRTTLGPENHPDVDVSFLQYGGDAYFMGFTNNDTSILHMVEYLEPFTIGAYVDVPDRIKRQ